MRFDGLQSDSDTQKVERSVLVLVPNPNDGSYFEAAVNGAKELEVTYPGTTVDVIGMGEISVADGMPTVEEELEFYKDYFVNGCESGKYDLIITGGGECSIPTSCSSASTSSMWRGPPGKIRTSPMSTA
jgi:hypothetical protein